MQHSQVCFKTLVFASVPTTRNVRSAEELFAIEKIAAQGMGSRRIDRDAWNQVHECVHVHRRAHVQNVALEPFSVSKVAPWTLPKPGAPLSLCKNTENS